MRRAPGFRRKQCDNAHIQAWLQNLMHGCMAALFLILVSRGHSARAAESPLVFSPCQIGAADAPQHLAARCATFNVPEDRGHPGNRKLGLHLAVLLARSSHPRPDPLFYVAGGPGQAATDAYVEEAVAFARIHSERDIVLLDQRGTGQSNRLDCPAPADAGLEPTADAIRRLTQDCLRVLPGDPRFYTTTVAVQDLDALRAALGYSEINLYGISYGTRVALEYLREYPQHTRSVVLDGVVPADLPLGPDVSLNAQRALDLIFHRCAEDPDCHRAFPHLTANVAALRHDIQSHPVHVSLRDPLSGAPLAETLDWEAVTRALRFMSYQSETAALLPLLVHQAGDAHDYAPLLADALMFSDQLNEGLASGMASAVICTEDVPFYRRDASAQRALRDTYLGAETLDEIAASCEYWPRGVIGPEFKSPVISSKPVLLLSGEDDPVTPPADAARAARTLSNSLSLIIPGQGHGNVFRGCVPRLVAQFVDAASAKGLDYTCIKQIRPFPFFVNFAGPSP